MKTVLRSSIFQLKFTHCVLQEVRFIEPSKKHMEEKESIAGISVHLPQKGMVAPRGASGLQLWAKYLHSISMDHVLKVYSVC